MMKNDMLKDKIKEPKPITDDTSIIKPNPTQPIVYGWNHCDICGLSLKKERPKERIMSNGVRWISLGNKKNFVLSGKKICWNCTFNLVKQFKAYNTLNK